MKTKKLVNLKRLFPENEKVLLETEHKELDDPDKLIEFVKSLPDAMSYIDDDDGEWTISPGLRT